MCEMANRRNHTPCLTFPKVMLVTWKLTETGLKSQCLQGGWQTVDGSCAKFSLLKMVESKIFVASTKRHLRLSFVGNDCKPWSSIRIFKNRKVMRFTWRELVSATGCWFKFKVMKGKLQNKFSRVRVDFFFQLKIIGWTKIFTHAVMPRQMCANAI